MSDYLTNLLIRTRHPERTIQPRLPSMFDPVSPNSRGEEVRGGDLGEEPHRAIEVNQAVPRHDPTMHQSSETSGQNRGDGGSHLERETQHREQAAVPIAEGERLLASSETALLSELKEVDLAMNSVSTVGAPNSRHFEPHGTSVRNPSEANTISLSSIDPSVVSDSTSSMRMMPPQEMPALWPRVAAQSARSPLRIPSAQTKSAGQGGSSLLMDESSSESPDNRSFVPTTQAHDQEPNSPINTRGGRVSASSSQQPLARATTARSDGEQHHRFPTTVSESEGTLAEVRKQAAAGHNAGDLSLDPSLVASVRTTKGAAPSQYLMSRQPGDFSGTSSSALDQQEPIATPRTLPRTSNNFVAVRRADSPMTAATISQASAASRGKPLEPVVQVTIGRVEVRAVPPPVRHQKNPKPSLAMSLDDYLKRRGGRSGG